MRSSISSLPASQIIRIPLSSNDFDKLAKSLGSTHSNESFTLEAVHRIQDFVVEGPSRELSLKQLALSLRYLQQELPVPLAIWGTQMSTAVNPFENGGYSGYDGFGGGVAGDDDTGACFVREDYETRPRMESPSHPSFNVVHREEAVGPDAAPYLLRDAPIKRDSSLTSTTRPPKSLMYTMSSLKIPELRVVGSYHTVRHTWSWRITLDPVAQSNQSRGRQLQKHATPEDAWYASYHHLILLMEYHYVKHNVPLGHYVSLIVPKSKSLEVTNVLTDLLSRLDISPSMNQPHVTLEFLEKHASPYGTPIFSDVPDTTPDSDVDKVGVSFKSNLLRTGDRDVKNSSDRNPLKRDSDMGLTTEADLYDAIEKLQRNKL